MSFTELFFYCFQQGDGAIIPTYQTVACSVIETYI